MISSSFPMGLYPRCRDLWLSGGSTGQVNHV
jgi:hypothetical protein